MNSAPVITANRPFKGPVACVRSAAAMASFGGCASALHQGRPASYPLDRNEGRVHPGEGSA